MRAFPFPCPRLFPVFLSLSAESSVPPVEEKTVARNSQAAASPPSMTLGMLARELSENNEQSAVMNSSLPANIFNFEIMSLLRWSNVGVESSSFALFWFSDKDCEMLEREDKASDGDDALTSRSIC